MQAPQLIYFVGSLVLISYLVRKAEKKWLMAGLLFWLYSPPILNDPRYMIHVSLAGIDLQPSRILFLFLLISLFLLILNAKMKRVKILDYSTDRLSHHELWTIFYVGIALLSITLNISALGARLVIVSFIKLSTFLLVYFFVRENISLHDFQIMASGIVAFAVLSSLVGIYQFFVDESFFRNGVSRFAFGPYTRANGFFPSEYEQGTYLTLAFIVGMMTVQNKWLKGIIMILIPLGVFFTMHRGSWTILLISFGVITLKGVRGRIPLIFATILSAAAVVFILLNTSYMRQFSGNSLDPFMERVLESTLKPRIEYDQFALALIQKYPLGIGNYSSEIYTREAYKFRLGVEFNKGVPYIIHNGLLSAAALYGVAGMIAFFMFLITGLAYYLQSERRITNFGLMACLFLGSFLMINMTQDFSFLGEEIGLFLGMLLASAHSLNSPLISTRHIPDQTLVNLTPLIPTS